MPAGVHEVRFRYEPKSLQAGIRISTLAAIVTLLIAGWGLYRRATGHPGVPRAPGEAP